MAPTKSSPSRAPTTPPAAADRARLPIDFDDEDYAPSRQTLLRRAAELGPLMTWSSIRINPSDPVLGAKMLPEVVERRARLRRVVKVAVGACLAFCFLALLASAFSTTPPPADARSSAPHPSVAKTDVETLEVTAHSKVHRRAGVVRAATKLAKRR